jgi:hypothetical protein
MLFSVKIGKELVCGGSGFRIVQWAGVERRCTPKEFHDENSLLFLWQGFKSAQKLGSFPTHNSRVTVSASIDKG